MGKHPIDVAEEELDVEAKLREARERMYAGRWMVAVEMLREAQARLQAAERVLIDDMARRV